MLVGLHNVEICLITPAERGVIHAVLLSSWKNYERPYLLLNPAPLVFISYICLYLRGGPQNPRRISTLAIAEVVILAAVQFSHYVNQGLRQSTLLGSRTFITRRLEFCFGYRPLY